MREKKAILIFGGGNLQQYILANAKAKNLLTVVIDPDENAFCKEKADVFRVVGGQDFEATLNVAKEFNVSGVITAATDKPLLMMARVAKELNLPFYSVETAVNSTDKLRMKEIFLANDIPCAIGREISGINDFLGDFPVILKPRDNSGSRGVFFCKNKEEFQNVFAEVKSFTKKETILVEEFIEGQEYSIESLHFGGNHTVLQFTEKTTTPFPYNVELEHKQPANIDEDTKDNIHKIIEKIGKSFAFENCASHTELKITPKGRIVVIETSPRLGGDFITSHLVPLSTGINMESVLLDIAIGEKVDIPPIDTKASMAYFFNFDADKLCKEINGKLDKIQKAEGVIDIEFHLKDGDKFPVIKNSLDRYGHFILQEKNNEELLLKKERIVKLFTI